MRRAFPVIEASGDYGKITLPAVTNYKAVAMDCAHSYRALAAAAANEVAQQRRSG